MIYSWCPIRKGTLALGTWPRFLQFLHVWLYTTVVTFPIIVTIVFWAVLSGPSTFDNKFDTWSNISLHALNTAFALFEISLTNVPRPPWIYLPLNIVLLACYLGVAYITSGTQHFYTYEFLDPKREGPVLAGYIVGIAVGECIVYALVYLAVVLRQKAARRHSFEPQSAGGDSDDDKERVKSGAAEEAMDEWQEVSKPETFDGVRTAL
ncbi:hypothetical protein AX14_014205 [Amanita brunnescens Koide BX004]|nr:hypothetical protein AX14_014205 [Amanita brunnescens Koide BX004]